MQMENEEHNEKINNDVSTIKHIVISGGDVTGFSFYGVLRESAKKNIWNIDNIETIYGTSIGSIVAIMLALKYEWDVLDDYLIKRPWQNLYKFNIYSMIDAIQKRGIFDSKVIEETLSPLFSGKDISIDVTMKELYEITNIELHFFTTEIHSFTLVDISHKTHPEWRVTDAIYSSSALPVLFTPYLKDDKCYCDGGLLMNYSISRCIENGADPREILGVMREQSNNKNTTVKPDSSLIDYAMVVLNKAIEKYLVTQSDKKIAIEYRIVSAKRTVYDILNTANSMEERIRLIAVGGALIKPSMA